MRPAMAIRTGKRIRFTYESHSAAVSQRQIEPHGILHMDGRWYLIGHCLLRRDQRTFRLDRVSGLELSNASFKRPANFDARRFLEERLAFLQSDYQVDVWVEMPFEEATSTFAPWRVTIEAQGNGVRLRCGRDRLEMFAGMLLATRAKLIVHSPPELR